jgi:hypothetical protein
MRLEKYNIIVGGSNTGKTQYAIALSKFAFQKTYYFKSLIYGDILYTENKGINIEHLGMIDRSVIILDFSNNIHMKKIIKDLPSHHMYFIVIQGISSTTPLDNVIKYFGLDYRECNIMHTSRGTDNSVNLLHGLNVYSLESLASEYRDERINMILE